MKRLLLFKLLFVLGVIVSLFAFILLNINISASIAFLLFGLILMIFSLIKHKMARAIASLPVEKKVKLTPAAYAMRSVTAQQQVHSGFFRRIFAQKIPVQQAKIDTKETTKKPAEQLKAPINPPQMHAVAIASKHVDEQTTAKMLKDYIQKAVKSGFPKMIIKQSAIKNKWPEDLFEKSYSEVTQTYRKMRAILALFLLFAVVVLVYVLYSRDILLFPYWFTVLRNASPIFYIGTILLLFGISLIFIVKIRIAMKMQHVEYRIAEKKDVDEIKGKLQQATGYQTDLDKMYAVLEEKGKLTIGEIAMIFNISKEQAEEWGKILKDQELATLHYPAVGEPELIWKKLRNIT